MNELFVADKPGRKVMLIDGHSLLHRAFYALPTFTTSAGESTNAVYGFAMMMSRLIEEQKPDFLGVAFDMEAPTFRHEEYVEYKAHREKMPEQLRPQVDLVRELVRAFRIPAYQAEGYEADDCMGTLAKQVEGRGCTAMVVTGDKDALQLVGPGTLAIITRRGITDTEVYDEQKVREKLGLAPWQVADLKGLMGDSSDNIPGVPGVGEKTATQLLQRYLTVEGVLEHADELAPRWKAALLQYAGQALLSKKLATIRLDAPVDFCFEESRRRQPDARELYALYLRLEFSSLLRKLVAAHPELGPASHPGPLPHGAPSRHPGAGDEEGARRSPGRVVAPDGRAVSGASVPAQEQLFEGLQSGSPVSASKGLFSDRDRAPGVEVEPCAPGRQAERQHRVVYTLDDAEGLAKELQATEEFGFDLVQDGVDPLRAGILGIGFALPEGSVFVPLAAAPHADGDSAARHEREVLATLACCFRGSEPAKFCHDWKPKHIALSRRGTETAGVRLDLMLASYLLSPGQGSHFLEETGLRLLRRYTPPFSDLLGKGGKPPRTLSEVAPEALADRAFSRLDLLWCLKGPLEQKLAEAGMGELLKELELPLVDVLARMEMEGFALDLQRLAELSRELEHKGSQLSREIYRLAGEEFNINSPVQLRRILFEKLGMRPGKTIKTGLSTRADVLEDLSLEHEIAARVLEYRQVTKLKTTYTDALPALVDSETGRVHTTFNQAVTATGRLSSTNPNLQNIPIRTDEGARIREAFIPGEPGWQILSADYSQIELRILAHMSQDENLIRAFLEGKDIHTVTASEIFGVPEDSVSPQTRACAKAVNFGIVYGITSFGLARGTGLSKEDAGNYIKTYFERYPGVKKYLDDAVKRARETGYVTTIFQRRRFLPDLRSKNRMERSFAERTAMNTPIQGSAADIIKLAMCRVHRELRKQGLRAKMLLQVHDELVFEVYGDELLACAGLVRDAMQDVVALKVPLIVDVKAGPNWRDVEDLGEWVSVGEGR